MEKKIINLFKKNSELTISQTAKKLGIERHTAAKYLKAMRDKGSLTRRTKGRSKIYTLSKTTLFKFLQENTLISQEVKNILKQIPTKISIQDKNYNIIYSNIAKPGQKCYQAYANRNTKCPNCPAEKTLQTGTTNTTKVNALQTQVQIKPIKNTKQETIGVMEVIQW